MGDRNERRGRGGRIMGVGVLAALVAIAVAYFANCIPGFGVPGSTPAPSRPERPAAAADGKTERSDALELTVDGDRCRRGSEPEVACSELCTALASEPKTRKVQVLGTLGTHAAVDALRKCLGDHGFRDVVVRTE